MATYEEAGPEIVVRVDAVMERYHRPLKAAGVRLSILMAHPPCDRNGDVSGPAVSVGGYPALAKIKITSHKDRVHGLGDAELIIDAYEWATLSDAEKDALIDHELTHLELRLVEDEKTGAMVVDRDDQERPKMKLRKHDHQFGWFSDVVRRHGRASQEWQQYEAFADPTGGPLVQLWLPYVDDSPQALLSRPKREMAGERRDEKLAALPY